MVIKFGKNGQKPFFHSGCCQDSFFCLVLWYFISFVPANEVTLLAQKKKMRHNLGKSNIVLLNKFSGLTCVPELVMQDTKHAIQGIQRHRSLFERKTRNVNWKLNCLMWMDPFLVSNGGVNFSLYLTGCTPYIVQNRRCGFTQEVRCKSNFFEIPFLLSLSLSVCLSQPLFLFLKERDQDSPVWSLFTGLFINRRQKSHRKSEMWKAVLLWLSGVINILPRTVRTAGHPPDLLG